MQGFHIGGRNLRRMAVYLADEPEQCFVLLIKRRAFQIVENARDQTLAAQQFSRNCGVGLQSKRAMILVRGVGCNQLANAR